jgi:predicted metal-dependent peptidase
MDEKVLKEAQKSFIRARVQLSYTRPFWAYLVMKLEPKWEEDIDGLYTATDGRYMFINAVKFLALDRRETETILVHEAAHCASGHFERIGSRDPMLWNLAGDIWIANMQEADGFKLIRVQEEFFAKQGINRTKYRDMPTEEIYDALCQNKSKGKEGKDGKDHWQGKCGCYKKPAKVEDKKAIEGDWKRNVIEASQLPGSKPGAWQELIEAALPKPPFTLKLYEYLNRGLGGETDWAHLNRRYIYRGQYMPTDTRIVMGRVAWVCDTSGSMCKEQLALAFGYFRGFRAEHPCMADLILSAMLGLVTIRPMKNGRNCPLNSKLKAEAELVSMLRLNC